MSSLIKIYTIWHSNAAVPTNRIKIVRNFKKMYPGLPAGYYLADRDEKYVIRHQNMRSQGLSGPISTSEIVLRYAFSTFTKRTDFNFSRFLIFLINIVFTFFKMRIAILRCNLEFFDQTTQSCDKLGVVDSLDR